MMITTTRRSAPRPRNFVAKALPHLRGGAHRCKSTRAGLKRELRQHLLEMKHEHDLSP